MRRRIHLLRLISCSTQTAFIMLFNLEPVRWRSSVWADTEQAASDGLVNFLMNIMIQAIIDQNCQIRIAVIREKIFQADISAHN